jgi:hypothetical protein
MKNKRVKVIAFLFVMLACTIVASMASAAIVQLDAIYSGWYGNNGRHIAGNDNYAIGDYEVTDGLVTRNFFVFDLSGIGTALPIGAATLSVYNPSSPNGYDSADPTETWSLWDVYHSIADLTANHAVADPVGLSIYDDLGGTNFLGSKVVSAADNGSLISVLLNNNALALLNAARGSQWAVGGSLTSLDGVDNTEFLFGNTDGGETIRLTLTTCNFEVGHNCYSYCPIGACPPSSCTVNVPGMAPGCMNIGQISYCGCAPGACAPSQCVVYIPTP